MADPLQFSDLYDTNGLAFLIGDTSSGSAADRKRAVNDAYLDLAQIKGFWRRRSTTITLTADTVAYNAPDGYDSPLRLYYRQSGRYYDVKFVSDALWLEQSATSSGDSGTPALARVTQTSATQNQIELTPPPASAFISAVTTTLTLEYFIEITRLSADSDEPILPANLRHHIVALAGYKYALAQKDFNLADRLNKDAILAKAVILKHDLTRTGRPRQIRPVEGYQPSGYSGIKRDYGLR